MNLCVSEGIDDEMKIDNEIEASKEPEIIENSNNNNEEN